MKISTFWYIPLIIGTLTISYITSCCMWTVKDGFSGYDLPVVVFVILTSIFICGYGSCFLRNIK